MNRTGITFVAFLAVAMFFAVGCAPTTKPSPRKKGTTATSKPVKETKPEEKKTETPPVTVEVKPEVKVEAKPEVKEDAKPQAKDEPKLKDEPKSEPKGEPKTEPKDEPKAEPKPVAEPKDEEKKPDQVAKASSTLAVVATPAIDKKANAPLKPGDWSQWMGTSYRNNAPVCDVAPMDWAPGEFDRKTGAWNKSKAKNVKWVAQLGSQTYGNAVVADGKVFVGTNNEAQYLKRYPRSTDLGCLLCFGEADGKFLWQHSSEKLPTGRVHDWMYMGICCSPLVEGKRLYFVTSRGEVRCLDTEGFHDGKDDGITTDWGRMITVPRKEDPKEDKQAEAVAQLNEGKLSAALVEAFKNAGAELPEGVAVKTEKPGALWTFEAKVGSSDRKFKVQMEGPNLSGYKLLGVDDKDEADVVWVLDMMKELGVSQHNMASCSVTTLGDILFVCTSNGVDESHINIPAPNAPSFIAIDKNTGKLLWGDSSPGTNIVHGQWTSPTVANLGGVDQVLFGGGDGYLYSFKANAGKDGKPEFLWKFDVNPKEAKWILGSQGDRNDIIATPVVYDGLVYLGIGQDPEHGEGLSRLWCIDPTRRGDVSPELAVNVADRTKPIPHKRVQAVEKEKGEVAIDNPNSAAVWCYTGQDLDQNGMLDFEETMHRTCGSVAIQDDILFIADFSGLFHCLDAKTGKLYWTHDMLAASWGSPMIAGKHVYIGDEDGDVAVFNITKEKHEPVFEMNMGSSVYSTPIIANGVLYISTKDHLFAITPDEKVAGTK